MDIRQFVTFRIGARLLGIDVLRVREINRILDITPVQHSSGHVRGLVNLRGQTVAVFDLGVRLGLEPREIGVNSHNIILKEEEVGFLVDAIGDVVEARVDEIEPSPANLSGIERVFIQGVVPLEKELLLVLSTPKLLEAHQSHDTK